MSSDGSLLSGVWAPLAESTGDRAYLQAMLDAEVALARALTSVGLASAYAASDIQAVAVAADYDLAELALRSRASGNPVVPMVAVLKARVAARSAGAVHQGATSQDILDTAAMLIASRCLDGVIGDLDDTIRSLGALAATHRDTPMAGRTLTQHATPTTFGLKAAGWRSLVIDARDRLAAVRRSLPAQLGGAAGTLAAYTAYAAQGDGGPDLGVRLVEAYASELGLAVATVPWHVLRSPIADLGGALAFAGGALGKLAADVLVLSRTEIGEVSEGAGGGSSAMPHKSNPVLSTMIAGASRQLPALASILYGALVAEDERPSGAWHAEWPTLREALRLAAGAARCGAELVGGLVVHPDRMRANLDLTHGLVASERVSIELSARIGAQAARSRVEEASRRAIADRTSLTEALGEPVDADPATYVGYAPAFVDAALRRQVAG